MKEYFYGQTYELTQELADMKPVLDAAIKYQQQFDEYIIPYSFWCDKYGWIYVKWCLNDKKSTKPVWRYSLDIKGLLQVEEVKVNLSRMERLRGKDTITPATVVTGDTHRKFDRIFNFYNRYGVVNGDTMIILGDAGINYMGGEADDTVKKQLSELGVRFLCIHGNHEMRPESTGLYREKEWNGGEVYVEDKYPLIMFAKDGEIYDICGYKTIVIGGAYSVDKYYRLSMGYHWFSDEQPSDVIKARVEQQLDKHNWKVDVVLSHTVPYQFRPIDLFLREIDQSKVDSSTEKWLGEVEQKLTYKRWYAGHYHCDREIDKLKIMYKKVSKYMDETNLKFEEE